MKILHVLDHSLPLHSGYSFRTRAILREQAALGWQTCHVTSGKQGAVVASVEEHDGLRFYRTAPVGGLSARLPVWRQWRVVADLSRRLAGVIALEQPDLIHAHSPALNGLAALTAGRRAGLPVVYECRAFWEDAAADHGTSRAGGLRYRLTRALETHIFRRVDAVTCICDGLRAEINSRGIPADRITVIPNAVDAGTFAFDPPRDDHLAADLGLVDKTVLGFVGSFYDYEGLDLAIAALPRLLARHPDIRLLLVGGGPREAALREQAAALDLTGHVIFAGRVPHAEVGRWYSLIDLLVYPRRPMRLTELVTPLKPLEAMAMGKLVLASDVGGHRELVRHGQTGYLFRGGDPSALAAAVDAVLAARADWYRWRAAGRAFVEQERTWRASVARYIRAYERALRGRSAAGRP